jgi:putative adenylate-forming enzyme
MQRLPITGAAELRQRFGECNRLGLSLAEALRLAAAEKSDAPEGPPGYSFGLSTGTLGSPGVFITTPRERAVFLGVILGKALSLRQLPGCRIALLLRHNNRLYSDIEHTRLLSLHYYDISAPIESWAGRLCASAPDVVVGPPSVLLEIVRTREFERSPLRPHTLLAGAEPLFPSERQQLVQAFGVPPRPIYQASEGFIAVACAHGNLHVNEDVLIAEWQHFRGASAYAVPVITDFSRLSQDVWRVRLDDIVRMASASCPCKSAYCGIADVEGRLGDVLYGVPDSGAPAALFPFAVEAAVGPILDGAGEWQIKQSSQRTLTILTQKPPARAVLGRVLDCLAALGGWENFTWAQLPPRPPEVKRRRFVREIDPASTAIIGGMLLPPHQ